MAKESNVGISIKDAFSEALVEEGFVDSTPTPTSVGPVTENVPVVEQPTAGQNQDQGVLMALLDSEDLDIPNTREISDSDTVEVQGEQVTVGELKNGYLRLSDYTKKTQEVAQLRAEAKDALALWEAIQDDPLTVVRKLAQRVNMGLNPLGDSKLGTQESKSVEPGQDIAQLVKAEVERALAESPLVKEIRGSEATAAVARAFHEIEEEWNVTLTDADKHMILEKAEETGSNDLSLVFAGLLQLANRRSLERKGLRETATATGISGSDGKLVLDNRVPDDFQDALKMAMRELELDSLSV